MGSEALIAACTGINSSFINPDDEACNNSDQLANPEITKDSEEYHNDLINEARLG